MKAPAESPVDGGEALAACAPEAVGLSRARLARIPAFFQSYLDRGKVAGIAALIARQGGIAHLSCQGRADLESGAGMSPETIFRIYSMSKPITSLGLMMLFEEGAVRLDESVSRYIPAFGAMRVWESGSNLRVGTRPPAREVRVHDLLTHTSGLTYGFMNQHPVDRLYRRAHINDRDVTLEETCARLESIPLLFDPGTAWNYSVATDICGRLIEVLAGEGLDAFLRRRIFEPLGMDDTGFHVPEESLPRLSANYEKDPGTGGLRLSDPAGSQSMFARPPAFLSGGGGLVSTIGDYARFCQMLLNGGAYGGAGLVSPKTLDLMTCNHLPGDRMLSEMNRAAFSENRLEGTGFGLGFSILLDQAAAFSPVTPGSYSWGGAASTYFWIDPAEEMFGILMAQFMPSDAYPLRPQFQQLAYAAVVE